MLHGVDYMKVSKGWPPSTLDVVCIVAVPEVVVDIEISKRSMITSITRVTRTLSFSNECHDPCGSSTVRTVVESSRPCFQLAPPTSLEVF